MKNTIDILMRLKSYFLAASISLSAMTSGCLDTGRDNPAGHHDELPGRGLCAHRGAMATHPENTLPAFRAAISAGAHMIEFDVQLTKDNELVVMHDATVDRTTNGTGLVTELTFEEIRKLDAGSWKASDFAGERVPTMREVLEIMPVNIWLNVHLKGDDKVAVLAARELEKEGRLHQAFLACGATAAAMARNQVPGIMICNMDRKEKNQDYVNGTIDIEAEFIQLRGKIYPGFAEYAKVLKDNGVRVNYYGTDNPDEIKLLFEYGVDFPLVNDIINSINVASELGISPAEARYAW